MEIKYSPIGVNNKLQMQITNFLAKRFAEDCGLALDEIGYFHMVNVAYTGTEIITKIYFHPEFATETTTEEMNGHKTVTVRREFSILNNVFFPGEYEHYVKFEKATVPKHKVKHTTLMLKDRIDEEEKTVLVLYCNIDMVLAAINNISLKNGNLRVKFSSSNQTKRPIMVSASSDMYPISISVEYNENKNTGFDKSEVEDYFKDLLYRKNEKRDMEKKIAQKARTAKRPKMGKSYSSYLKYR